jgi:FkbM family methyltransferase
VLDKNFVWQELARTHLEFKRENFPMDDPYALIEIVVNNCYRYTPKKGDKVLDIGANIGIFTALCALNGAEVTAYEPNKEAGEVLLETVRRNHLKHLVTVIPMPVWTTGSCQYFPGKMTPEQNPEMTWTSYNGAVLTPEPREGELVPAMPFSWAVSYEPSWDCVKIDIEGAEFPILLEAKDETLRKIKFLTVELHNGWADKARHDALIERLQRVFSITGTKDGDPRFAGEDRYISVQASLLP